MSFGHKLHIDLNGALNILKKSVGIIISTVKKSLSFLVLRNGVATRERGCNTQDLGKPRPKGRGIGQMFNILITGSTGFICSIFLGKT